MFRFFTHSDILCIMQCLCKDHFAIFQWSVIQNVKIAWHQLLGTALSVQILNCISKMVTVSRGAGWDIMLPPPMCASCVMKPVTHVTRALPTTVICVSQASCGNTDSVYHSVGSGIICKMENVSVSISASISYILSSSHNESFDRKQIITEKNE